MRRNIDESRSPGGHTDGDDRPIDTLANLGYRRTSRDKDGDWARATLGITHSTPRIGDRDDGSITLTSCARCEVRQVHGGLYVMCAVVYDAYKA